MKSIDGTTKNFMSQEQALREILTRGVENVYPSFDTLEQALKSNKKLKIYYGIDPTGKSLHLGHMVELLKLRQFQELGHHIILLIGDFTAQIGDPTDKLAARKPLTHKQVLANAKDYTKQASRFLDIKKTEVLYNSKWHNKLSFKDVIELSMNFSVQRLLERDMFENRIKEGKVIHLHEFLYPLMQAYDSVAMDVDMEVGGSDQIFNMLAGRTLMKQLKGKEKFVLASKLVVDSTGKKMGKTEGNLVSLDDSPKDMFGIIMSWPDEFIVSSFELLTRVNIGEVEEIREKMKKGENPKGFKERLASEIVTINYGTSQAEEAREQFKKIFSKKEKPDQITEIAVSSKNIIDILVETKLAPSRGEGKRLLQQKGVKVDDTIASENAVVSNGSIIQKGKRHFVRVKFK